MEHLRFPTEGTGALQPETHTEDTETGELAPIYHINDYVRTKWGRVMRRPDPDDSAPELPVLPKLQSSLVSRPQLQMYQPDFDPFDPDDSWLTESQPVEPVPLKLYEPPPDEPGEVAEQGNGQLTAEDVIHTDNADFFGQLGLNDFYGAD